MTDIYNIEDKYKKQLTQPIIERYINLKILDASDNSKISNINQLVELEILNAYGHYYGINNIGIINCINLKSQKID